MEITPRELRDVEIAEAFRGYNREVVNDLLERAAATVDASNERVRELSERLKAAQLEADRSRETEDILHRTLLLAQRAADEAVAEAQQKARAMMEEAELESHKLLADAQTEAQQRGDEERVRLEGEVIDLAARRDTLLADVDTLTQFETDYRDRLAAALEQDLEALRTRDHRRARARCPRSSPSSFRSRPKASRVRSPRPRSSPSPNRPRSRATRRRARPSRRRARVVHGLHARPRHRLERARSAEQQHVHRQLRRRTRTDTYGSDAPVADASRPESDTDAPADAYDAGDAAGTDDSTIAPGSAEPTYFEAETFASRRVRRNRPPGSPRSARPTPGSRMPATPVPTLRRRTDDPGTSTSRRARST